MAAVMRSNTAVDTGSNLASWVLIMYMETPADWANSATSSGGTTLELSGPLENTTTTFLPVYCAASFSVSNRVL